MASRPDSKPRIPLRVWLRFATLGVLLVTGFALVRTTSLGELLTEERLTALAAEVRGTSWAPLVLIGLYTVLAVVGVPLSPLLVAGAVFGALYGTIYSTIGLFLGATASFLLGKLLGRDFVVHLTGERLRRAERLFERHGFWPLVQTRFLPLPFLAVNYGAALAGVRPSRFIIAAVVGLVPSTWLHTFFIAHLIAARGGERAAYLAGYAGAFLLFNVLIGYPWLRERRRRRQRYRELLARRAARPESLAES